MQYATINKIFRIGEIAMRLIHIFACNLKRFRKLAGLSQEQLAELSELHRTYISSLEREKRNISIDNIQKLAVALNVDAYKFFIEEDKS